MEQVILASTRHLFVSEGIDRFTMDDLASRQGISKKTLYRFFPSRQDLVEHVCRWVSAEYESAMQAWDGNHKGPLDKLLGLISNVVVLCKSVSPLFFQDLERHYPLQWMELQQQLSQAIDYRLRRLLEEGIENGVFRNSIHPELVISIWQQHVQTDFKYAARLVNDYSKDEVFRQAVYLFLYGIIAPAAIPDLENRLASFDWRTATASQPYTSINA